jgi:hypothetical protein
VVAVVDILTQAVEVLVDIEFQMLAILLQMDSAQKHLIQ